MNLERILKLLFKDMPSSAIMNGAVNAYSIKRDEFVQYAFPGAVHYSENELRNLWHAYSRIREVDGIKNRYRGDDEEGISVFDIIFYYANRNLVLYNNEILCRYNCLLEWRELTMNISEDLLTCAYWARTIPEFKMKMIGFGWPVVIGHNNHDLNQILRREMAENHFHLYGSAPIFHLSWISMMNHVDQESMVIRALKEFDRNQRMYHPDFGGHRREESLVVQYRQAAYIRVLLLAGIMGRPFHIGPYKNEEKLDFINQYNQMTTEEYERKLDIHWNRTIQNVMEIVCDNAKLEEYLPELCGIIDSFRNEMDSVPFQGALNIDYALLALKGTTIRDEDSLVFTGERYFLYAMLNRIWRRDPLIDQRFCNLFYTYLIIRENIREELIQVNNKIGFHNFKIYESRKKKLILDPVLNKRIARYAVSQSLLYHNMLSLEVRISPGNSWTENRDYITTLDRIIADNDLEKKERFFYCIHFIKEPDDSYYKEGPYTLCRHYALRDRIRRQARAILELRENAPECSARILAIDAANSEIGCRPEVFGPVFRQLRNRVDVVDDGLFTRKLPQLRVTYHVGEDFLDLADGLRAIDETVNFLTMDCGDRLGHAIALGINVEEWYASKNYRIQINIQDYLDNIVWIYHQLIRYKIPGMDNLKDYLRRKFDIFFREIYLSNIDSDLLAHIKGINSETIPDVLESGYQDYNIAMYYYSWMIRGDEPGFYENGYFRYDNLLTESQDNRINQVFPKNKDIRKIPEVGLLFYYYHFDARIRNKGNEQREFIIKPDYIAGVKAIQKEMRKRIARRGIAIETNPSSNYLIGTFKQYTKHPIFTFYNKGLPGFDACQDEPQLVVSINTDDMGVFSTSLTNEYALIARDLESINDQKGEPLYTKKQIYTWLDEVRSMGIDMSFSKVGSAPVLKYEIDELELEPFEF